MGTLSVLSGAELIIIYYDNLLKFTPTHQPFHPLTLIYIIKSYLSIIGAHKWEDSKLIRLSKWLKLAKLICL